MILYRTYALELRISTSVVVTGAMGEEDEEEEDEGYEEEALYDPPADTYAAPAPVQQKWDPGRGVGKGAQAATG